ncbi:MAG: hypothetical protein K0S61_3301 [Anaerocolumna sp.]|jgi:hypothetical protein|nr:hypothetical protein [Anaerocolumna sp.]
MDNNLNSNSTNMRNNLNTNNNLTNTNFSNSYNNANDINNYNSNVNNKDNFNNNLGMSKLPMMALADIPVPNQDAKEIVALVKTSGKVTGYQLSDGRVLDKEDGINLARQGGILGVGIASRKGSEYLKSLPDGTENNNLGNLPAISGNSDHNNISSSTTNNQFQ